MQSFAFHSDGNRTRDDDVGPVNSNGLLVLVMFTDYYDTSSGIMVAGIQTKTENKEKTNLYFTMPRQVSRGTDNGPSLNFNLRTFSNQ
jgi:hypothetical protein